MAERCPDCAPRHKIRVWKEKWKIAPYPQLWYVDCECGWEPEPGRVSGTHGRPTWDLALFAGQVHQKEMLNEGRKNRS